MIDSNDLRFDLKAMIPSPTLALKIPNTDRLGMMGS